MSNYTLLPCPFCGDSKWLEIAHLYGNSNYLITVSCKTCGAEGCEKETMEQAAAAWNRRAPVPVVLEWVEQVFNTRTSHLAIFNDVISARITDYGTDCVIVGCGMLNSSGQYSHVHTNRKITAAQARAWCVEQITKIITPKNGKES